jgi:hypothetical protein
LFELLKSTRKLWRANRTAIRVSTLLRACMCPVLVTGGAVAAKLQSDEFVLGYIYGATMAWSVIHDDLEEKGYLKQQVFEQLFPGNGRTLRDACDQRVLQQDAAFMRACTLGCREMTQGAESEGRSGLPGLLDHILRSYGS